MRDHLHQILPIALLIVIVATLWTYADAKSQVDHAAQSYWPALGPVQSSVAVAGK